MSHKAVQYGPYKCLLLLTTDRAEKRHWRRRVTKLLDQIKASPVGHHLLEELKTTKRSVIMRPRSKSADEARSAGKFCNAGAAPLSWRNATSKGKRVLHPASGRFLKQLESGPSFTGFLKYNFSSNDSFKKNRDEQYGTGKGSTSFLYFDPWTWTDPRCRGGVGSLADEILFHEIVHAIRQAMGIAQASSTRTKMDTFEEYVAITLANMYTSDVRPQAKLRDNHHGFTMMTDPKAFLTRVSTQGTSDWIYMMRIRKEMPKLFKSLCPLPPNIWFNPCFALTKVKS